MPNISDTMHKWRAEVEIALDNIQKQIEGAQIKPNGDKLNIKQQSNKARQESVKTKEFLSGADRIDAMIS